MRARREANAERPTPNRRKTREGCPSLALSRRTFYTGAMKFHCRCVVRLGLIGLLLLSGVSASHGAEPEKIIALKAARLFDGKSKTLASNGVVIVQGSKIVDAGSSLPIPSD